MLVFLSLHSQAQAMDSLPTNSSMVEVNAFLERYFTKSNSTTLPEWLNALPNEAEKKEMKRLLTSLWYLDSFDIVTEDVMKDYLLLKRVVTISVVKGQYCVIHELIPEEEQELFPRMWGYTAITAKGSVQREIHHSAAHFDSEGPVLTQAAALFENTMSRSLVAAGASRYAVKGHNPSDCQAGFEIADAAHNSRTMFHWVNTVLRDLAEEECKGKENGDHFFVQWHGMAENSCPASDVFLSAGIHNSSIYDSNIPVKRMKDSFNKLASTFGLKASTPKEDANCKLTAANNVFGRYVNGVSGEEVCSKPAIEENIIGRFAHIEQKAASRENISLWTAVILDAFPNSQSPVCFPSIFVLFVVSVLIFFA
ncbi:unnamed protein product [Nippostrongylus brasiliensis]|uniref:Peptidase_M4_C domain-containing protein n=1 Tax=Nippostrongylus brasiliensis TaxID=27835 RepID=A0A0N4YJX8_NIPBR|nr:unnamed protein product [Nippostrongylus brasiliensis]